MNWLLSAPGVHTVYVLWWVAALSVVIPWWFGGYEAQEGDPRRQRMERGLVWALTASALLTFWLAEQMEYGMRPDLMQTWPVILGKLVGTGAMIYAASGVWWVRGWYWVVALGAVVVGGAGSIVL